MTTEPPSTPKRIAIIDDDRDTVEFIAIVLEEAGYQTRVSTNHDDILLLAAEPWPDLFMLNLMRGWEYIGMRTMAVLRDHPVMRSTPIILCSANTTFLHTQRQALAQRKCLTLTKPFLHHELLDVVQEALALA